MLKGDCHLSFNVFLRSNFKIIIVQRTSKASALLLLATAHFSRDRTQLFLQGLQPTAPEGTCWLRSVFLCEVPSVTSSSNPSPAAALGQGNAVPTS